MNTWLDAEWRSIIRYAWSIRLIALCGLLSALEFILPIFMSDPPLPRGVFAGFAFAVSVAAFISRLIVQKKVN